MSAADHKHFNFQTNITLQWHLSHLYSVTF